MEKEKLMEDTALKVFDAARSSVLMDLRFLSGAVNKLSPQAAKIGYLATDGQIIGFSPVEVLKRYKASPEQFTRNYLHVMMHCIFRHPFIGDRIEKLKWTVACDIAVENLIEELDMSRLGSLGTLQKEKLDFFRKELKFITAEKLSHYFDETHTSILELERLYKLFAVDSHKNWFGDPDKKKDENSSEQNDSINSEENGLSKPKSEEALNWKKVGRNVRNALEAFSKKQGIDTQELTCALKALEREKYNYSDFLRKFAVYGEMTEINDEEFDYIYYNYGLQLYGKMPLIEPLEYKDVKRIKDLVIAIDTSRSVNGELVQRFMQKTFNILKSTENFFRKVNIHIIQCDTKIKEDTVITSLDELDDFIQNMELKGFGGTDFRPVFQYVDWLNDTGGFADLGGVIYFTDGYGEYPKLKPAYNTAFVFVENEIPDEYIVPSWAMKIVLSKYELQEL